MILLLFLSITVLLTMFAALTWEVLRDTTHHPYLDARDGKR